MHFNLNIDKKPLKLKNLQKIKKIDIFLKIEFRCNNYTPKFNIPKFLPVELKLGF